MYGSNGKILFLTHNAVKYHPVCQFVASLILFPGGGMFEAGTALDQMND